MNRKTDNELLDDVLAEAAPANFREALLDETLRIVRRRRRLRQVRNVVGMLIFMGFLGVFVRQQMLKKPSSIAIAPQPTKPVEKGYTVIHSQPLSASDVITTHPPGAIPLITSAATVEIVETTPGQFRLINDQQLLALVAAHPAVLVRTGPNSEQLVFANPQDAKGFPLN
jgi:hypothetical protein